MKFGVALPAFSRYAGVSKILGVARRAEELGFDSVWTNDHLGIPTRLGDIIWTTTYEPLITLAFVSSITERVQLGTSILILPLRRPVVLAKQAATLDTLSKGRLVLGVGVGWIPEESESVGTSFEERGAIADEAIEAMRLLWTSEKPSFSGKHVRFPAVSFYPKPYNGRSIPIWIGGNTKPAIRRAAKLGDAWHPTALPEDIAKGVKALHRYAKRFGRNPEEILVTGTTHLGIEPLDPEVARGLQIAGTVDHVSRRLEDYVAAGVSHLKVNFPFSDIDDTVRQMKVFVSQIAPSFR